MADVKEDGWDPWRSIDGALADTESAFDFLTLITPGDLDDAWERFRRFRCEIEPELRLPELDIDAASLLSRIERLPFDRIEDGEIRFLLTGKHAELSWELGMLQVRDTPAFLTRSMLHYGPVTHELLQAARRILDELPVGNGKGPTRDADEVRRRAEEELDSYRRKDASFEAEPEQKEEQEGLQASHGDLLIPAEIELAPDRLEALVQHEVGAHVVTHHNGARQPLQVLRNGLSDYDELQEGFAVVAEFFADGLTSTRMRTLAARTVAVHCLEDGASFVDTFRVLADLGMGQVNAFDMTARIYACGGFTRDQIYLRGILWLLRYLSSGGDVEPLYIGKIGLQQVPAVMRLRRRGFLTEPALRPAFLEGETGASKLARLREGVTPVDLVSDRS